MKKNNTWIVFKSLSHDKDGKMILKETGRIKNKEKRSKFKEVKE